MPDFGIADSVHRLVKQVVDSGSAMSFAEADAMFRRYRLAFHIGVAEATDPLHQAALLTGVALCAACMFRRRPSERSSRRSSSCTNSSRVDSG